MPRMKRHAVKLKGVGNAAGSVAKEVGARLRELRQQRKMSQGEIERRTGLLRCYVSRVEGGYTIPSVDTLEKFAAALAVPMHTLFIQGREKALRPISVEKLRKPVPADPYADQMRHLVSKMDDRDRDTFLSLVRKLALRAA